MTSIWATSLLAAFAAIALTVAFQFIKGRRLKARLKRLRDMREEPEAFDRCKAQFPEIPHARVQAAYVWVQELVGIDNLPLHPEDDLSETLEVDQGSVDDKFEASYECYGKEQDSGIAAGKPLRTVKDLMAAVLASGYESYPSKKSHTEFHDAA